MNYLFLQIVDDVDRPQRAKPQQSYSRPENTQRASPSNKNSQKLDYYKPASGPAYATAENIAELNGQASAQDRFDTVPYTVGSDVTAEQRSIQEGVFHGANAFKPDVRCTDCTVDDQ